MLRLRSLATSSLAATACLLTSPLTHAASILPNYQIHWAGNHTIFLLGPHGKTQKRLTRGQHVTIRKGSDLLTVSLGAAGAAATTGTPAPPAIAQELLGAINASRFSHTVPLLTLDPRESTCSAAHSTHMASIGAISHDQFPSDVCVTHMSAGENVGEAGGDPMTAAIWLHHSMMAEGPCPHTGCPNGELEQHGHYLNLINPAYRHVGIGIVVKNGVTWVTEDFTD